MFQICHFSGGVYIVYLSSMTGHSSHIFILWSRVAKNSDLFLRELWEKLNSVIISFHQILNFLTVHKNTYKTRMVFYYLITIITNRTNTHTVEFFIICAFSGLLGVPTKEKRAVVSAIMIPLTLWNVYQSKTHHYCCNLLNLCDPIFIIF